MALLWSELNTAFMASELKTSERVDGIELALEALHNGFAKADVSHPSLKEDVARLVDDVKTFSQLFLDFHRCVLCHGSVECTPKKRDALAPKRLSSLHRIDFEILNTRNPNWFMFYKESLQ